MIATIVTLAGLLLPVLAKAKNKAQQANCLSNLRQLNYGWFMYYGDNGGWLAESYPVSNPEVWVKGDMRIPNEATDPKLIEAGKLYTYHRNSTIYRCPTDKGVEIDGKRITQTRSYSMNGFMGARDSSLGAIPASASKFVPFFARDSDLVRPSQLWVLVDEDERSISDGFFVTDPMGRVWYDRPSISSHRHRFRYTLTYADGHAEALRLRDARSRNVVRSETEQSGNLDLQALAELSTVPK